MNNFFENYFIYNKNIYIIVMIKKLGNWTKLTQITKGNKLIETKELFQTNQELKYKFCNNCKFTRKNNNQRTSFVWTCRNTCENLKNK